MSFLFSVFIFLSVAAFVYAIPLNPTPVPLAQVASPQQQQNHQWHYPKISGPEAIIMVGFLAGIIAVIGWVVVHRTALTRDREARDHADRKEKEGRRSELLLYA